MTTRRQEPRPAYHRRIDIERLQELAKGLPLLVADEEHGGARHYVVRQLPDRRELQRGRHEVVYAFLNGWRQAARVTAMPACDRCSGTDETAAPFVTICRNCYDCWI